MKHGEIWNVNFAPNVGDEIGKIRPALIISSDAVGRLRLRIVVPITDPGASIQTWHVPIQPDATNGLTKLSIADCFQIKSISQVRFVNKIGILSSEDLEDVKVGLIKVLQIF